jgi:hypothetical protein
MVDLNEISATSQFRQIFSVGIETRLRVGRPRNRGSILGRDKRFSLPHSFQTDSGAHRTSYPVGTGRCFTVSKADHLLPSTTAFKNMCSCTSIPPHTSLWHGVQLSRDSFTFSLPLSWLLYVSVENEKSGRPHFDCETNS